MIEQERLERAKQQAIELASKAGEDEPYNFETYKRYYIKPDELFASPDSTIKGLHKHFNSLEQSGIGAGFVYSGEFAADLASGDSAALMKYMSEVYDTGNKELKLVGDKSEQLTSLKSLPVSALFLSSPAAILYDEKLKRLFKSEFSSKLARRSFFCYVPESIPEPTYSSVEEMLRIETKIEDDAVAVRQRINQGVLTLTEQALPSANTELTVSSETRALFNLYRKYNKLFSATMNKRYPIAMLVRQHLQWKAFKLAGALAIFDQSDTIETTHYIQAINFCELHSSDMTTFEYELSKEPYQFFCDYMHSIAIDNKSSISLHDLRKFGYISTTGASKPKLKELVTLSSSYDKLGIYSLCDDGICFEEIVPTTQMAVSYVPVSGSKETRAKQCSSGFVYAETTFPALANMLQKDFAYSPYKFIDGKRGAEYVTGGARWIVFDVDESGITADELHFILQDINHHIALTSNPDNDFKFRVLLELDAPVTLESRALRFFMNSVADYISIKYDPLPKSQVYFSYADRPVYSVTDKSPIAIKDHVLFALSESQEQSPKPKPTTKAEAKALLDNPLDTFNYCFECPMDQPGSLAMIKMAHHARKLGMATDDIIALVYQANDYWSPHSMPESRLESTIISQIRRW